MIRRLLLTVCFLFLAASVQAQSTTANLHLTLPAQGTTPWDTVINNNFSLIDAALGLVPAGNVTVANNSVLCTDPTTGTPAACTASQINTVIGSVGGSSQAAGLFLASPAAAAGVPSYRTIVSSDLPPPSALAEYQGVVPLGTSSIAAGSCAKTTVAAANVLATDAIDWSFASDPTGGTGYAPSVGGTATLSTPVAYPSAGSITFALCNNTASTITPSAMSLNANVIRTNLGTGGGGSSCPTSHDGSNAGATVDTLPFGYDANHQAVAYNFVAGAAYTSCRMDLTGYKSGSPTFGMEAAIYTDSSGLPGTIVGTASSEVLASAAGTADAIISFTGMSGGPLVSGTTYWVVLAKSSGSFNYYTDFIHWSMQSGSSTSRGAYYNGTTWTLNGTYDFGKFVTYGP